MKFKDLPVKNKDILEGREPLPEEATYLMDKYTGKGIVKKFEKGNKKDYSTDLYAPMNQSELEARKWGRELTDAFDVNPKTLEMTAKEEIPKEIQQKYFDLVKKNLQKYGETDIPSINTMRGTPSGDVNQDYVISDLQYDPSFGSLVKSLTLTPETTSLRDLTKKEEAMVDYQQISPYANLLQSVKQKYKNIPDSEKRLELENADLIEKTNKNPELKYDMENVKKNQQKVIDLYKQHSKKFGGTI
jgi:hypothetical protein